MISLIAASTRGTSCSSQHDSRSEELSTSATPNATREERRKERRTFMFAVCFGTCVLFSVDGLSQIRYKYLGLMRESASPANRVLSSGNYNDLLKAHAGEVKIKKRSDKESEEIEIEDKELHCSLWEISLDEWWQEHPDWEVALENDTHTCFSPVEHEEKADFYRDLHRIQSTQNCSALRTRYVIGTGFAASIGYLLDGFWSAFRENRPFERSKHREGFRWMYTPPFNSSSPSSNSWATCPSEDMTCYFLPLTKHCQNANFTISHEDQPIAMYYKHELQNDQDAQEKFIWLEQYFMRPKQLTRYHLHQLQRDEVPLLSTPCTVLHVRRADATSEPQHPRNYYPLSRYLSRGTVSPENNETIVLLTDDESAIDEANVLYPEYKWVYVNRTRHRGKMPKHSHIPSNDESLEVLYIMAELNMVRSCHKLVHGKSNFVNMISRAMQLERGINETQTISIEGDNVDSERRIPAEKFMKELDKMLEKKAKLNKDGGLQTKFSVKAKEV